MTMTDRERVIKGLMCCQYSSKSHCDGCPYCYEGLCGTNDCTADLASDALDLLKQETANLYKCQNCGTWVSAKNVIRCKDCKYWSAERINDFNKCRRWINVGVKNFATMGEWYCADGERRDDDD